MERSVTVRLLSLVACLMVGSAASGQSIRGQWDFDGSLRATVGMDGSFWSSARDIVSETQFGTTASFGIADIGGQPASVMRFPASDPKMGYVIYPEIEANGGGLYVNQYTLIMDILFPSSSGGVYRALLQTNECNVNDADLYVNPSDGLGISGVYEGTLTPDVWHRVVVTVDLVPPVMVKYIDGVKVGEQTTGLSVLDGRFSLYTRSDRLSDPILRTILFTSSTGESAPGFVNSIQFRDHAMSEADVAALGGPSAAGIPGGPGVTGQWDFDSASLAATVGLPLEYFRGCPPRPPGCAQNLPASTIFGKASQLGIPRINGADPTVMRFPLVQPCAGYLFEHGITPNGGGDRVNQYSIIMDVFYPFLDDDPDTGGWAALYQANLANIDDAELYIRGPEGGVGILGVYDGNLLNGQWHRIGAVADLTVGQLQVYVDGLPVVAIFEASLDDRFSLDSAVLLFTEPNFYTSAGYVNSVQIRDYAMQPAEIAALGGPTAGGIGVPDPRPAPDVDNNGFIDQADLVAFEACITGPAIPITEANRLLCRSFDADGDADVDQDDFGAFQAFYSGVTPCGANCYYP